MYIFNILRLYFFLSPISSFSSYQRQSRRNIKMASQNQELLSAIAKAADLYPKPAVTFGYGTAGFRTL